jgi:hypothetical protein
MTWPSGWTGLASGTEVGAGATAIGAGALAAAGIWIVVVAGAAAQCLAMRIFSSPSLISSSEMPEFLHEVDQGLELSQVHGDS